MKILDCTSSSTIQPGKGGTMASFQHAVGGSLPTDQVKPFVCEQAWFMVILSFNFPGCLYQISEDG